MIVKDQFMFERAFFIVPNLFLFGMSFLSIYNERFYSWIETGGLKFQTHRGIMIVALIHTIVGVDPSGYYGQINRRHVTETASEITSTIVVCMVASFIYWNMTAYHGMLMRPLGKFYHYQKYISLFLMIISIPVSFILRITADITWIYALTVAFAAVYCMIVPVWSACKLMSHVARELAGIRDVRVEEAMRRLKLICAVFCVFGFFVTVLAVSDVINLADDPYAYEPDLESGWEFDYNKRLYIVTSMAFIALWFTWQELKVCDPSARVRSPWRIIPPSQKELSTRSCHSNTLSASSGGAKNSFPHNLGHRRFNSNSDGLTCNPANAKFNPNCWKSNNHGRNISDSANNGSASVESTLSSSSSSSSSTPPNIEHTGAVFAIRPHSKSHEQAARNRGGHGASGNNHAAAAAAADDDDDVADQQRDRNRSTSYSPTTDVGTV